MCRHNLALELLAVTLATAAGVVVFFSGPAPWFVVLPLALFTSYVVFDTLLPAIWETPPEGIRYEPDDDDE